MSLTGLPTRAPAVRQVGYEGAVQVQRALDSLKVPVDTVLAFLNGVFTGNTTSPTLTLSGLTLTGALVGTTAAFSGALSAASAAITGAISGASLAISGNATVGGTLGVTGAVTGASYSGGPVSGTTGTFSGAVSGGSYTGGSSAAGTPSVLGLTVGTTGISSFGPLSGTTVTGSTSVVSGAGFKCIVGPAIYWNPTYPGGTVTAACAFISTGGAASAAAPFFFIAPFAGSVVGISAFNQDAATGTVQVIVQKNGSTLWSPNVIISPAKQGSTTSTKGTNTFVAGDRLGINLSMSTTGDYAVQVYLVLEMTA